MSMLDATPSNDSNGSHAWAASWTHLRVERRGHGYCRVTFDHPPINAITATTVDELAELVGLIEEDDDLNVVVFGSANPDFYLSDHDAEHDPRAWAELLARLARAPVISIASIRGRARGAGSEFLLACDMRFASRENTLLGRFETSAGGGARAGGVAPPQLSRLVGPGRALEMMLLADDLDGPRAELYGCVNRTIADDRLDDEVERIAEHLDRFEHEAIGRAKSYAG